MFNCFSIAALAIVYWTSKLVCSSGCVRRTLLEQIFASPFSPRKLTGTKLGGVHRTNIRPGASSLVFNRFSCYSILYRQTGVQLRLCLTSALGTNFWQLFSTQEVQWYQAWRCSSFDHPARRILIDIELIYYSWPSYSILEKQTGVQLRLCSTNAIGTNFCKLLSTLKVDWYLAWMRSSFDPMSRSIHINI